MSKQPVHFEMAHYIYLIYIIINMYDIYPSPQLTIAPPAQLTITLLPVNIYNQPLLHLHGFNDDDFFDRQTMRVLQRDPDIRIDVSITELRRRTLSLSSPSSSSSINSSRPYFFHATEWFG